LLIEEKIEKLGHRLPELPAVPIGSFLPAVEIDGLVFVSGATGGRDHAYRGRFPRDLTQEQGYEAARFAVLAGLANLKALIGDLDRVERIVKLLGFVNSMDGFTETPAIMYGASDLLIELWGENGRHARSAIGVAALPANAPVELEMIVKLKP